MKSLRFRAKIPLFKIEEIRFLVEIGFFDNRVFSRKLQRNIRLQKSIASFRENGND
jgi:hypothetical protein